MPTFGAPTSQTGTSQGNEGGPAIYVCRYTTPADIGTINALTAYLALVYNETGAPAGRGVVYADNGGVPANLITVGTVDTPLSAGAKSYNFPLPVISLAPNTPVWIGVIVSDQTNWYGVAGATGQGYHDNHITYPTPQDLVADFYPTRLIATAMSAYVTYTGAGPVPPTANFTYTTSLLTLNVTDTSTPGSGAILTRDWDWGDGSAHGSGASASHTYASSGSKIVILTVTDSNGLISVAQKTITVSTAVPPVAIFTATPDYLNVVLDASASHGVTNPTITQYIWNFGDTTPVTTATTPVISHAYAQAGTYTINLTVVDNGGLSSPPATPQTLTLVEQPFTINGTTPWDSVAQGTTLEAGTYQISVPPSILVGATTYNFLQWEDGSTANPRTFDLSVDRIISATYSASVPPLTASANGPYTPHINTSQYFAGSASGGLAPYTWLWNFGDGATSTLQNPSHTYTTAGVYDVSLQVSDSNSPQAVTTVHTTATVAALLPPIAAFTATPTSVYTGQTVSFNGTSSHAQEAGATIVSYQWNFGDGATGTGATATHVYSTAGTMNVVLTVTDSLGLTDTETATVTVSIPPTWSLTVNPSAGGSTSWTGPRSYPAGQAADPVTATRNNNFLFLYWLFDGNNVGAANPYTVPAQTAGTSHTLQPVFAAAPTLVAEAGGPYSAHITSATVQFAGSASGGVPPYRTWAWNFGDGTVSTLQNPSHTYTSAGTYNVTLQVIDTDGNLASDSTTVTISNYYPPTAIISNVSPLNPLVGQTVTFNGSGSYVGEPPPTIITGYSWDFGDGATASGAVVTHQFTIARTYAVKLTVTDSNSMTNSTTFNITVGAKPQRTFIVQLGPNGSSVPGAGRYYQDYDTAFTVTAQPDPHHKLVNWNVNGTLSTELTQTIPASATPVTETFTLTATFEAIIWNLDVSAGVGGSVIGTPSGQYVDGTAITESAKPDAGNMYDYWTVNGNREDLNPQSFVIDKDYVLKANFKPIPTYTVAGSVKDATGTPVTEVRVSAEGTAYSTYTIADGSYILEVPSGTYNIVFEKAGFGTVKVSNVSVTGNVQVADVTISSTPVENTLIYAAIVVGAIGLGFFLFRGKRGTQKRSR